MSDLCELILRWFILIKRSLCEIAMSTCTLTQNAAVLYNRQKLLIPCNLFLISIVLPLAKAIDSSHDSVVVE